VHNAPAAAAVLARVTAIDLVGSEGGQPAGYALAGPVAAAAGARGYLVASAAVMLVAATAFTLPRPLRVSSRAPLAAG
jgi:hypothetical protein